MSQYIAGESRAFDVLFHRYQSRLLNFINRTIGDRERAEDLVQEAFIRVHRHIARFDRAKKFSTWIYTIAGNLAKNELRNRGRNPIVLFQAMGGLRDARARGALVRGDRRVDRLQPRDGEVAPQPGPECVRRGDRARGSVTTRR
ncbi:MAG: sigma-70 family RNA polymerase sigma factor [Gemmatimonadetes bacterium]|nr:sigma-70 family RNA polymerase sigma factor [Gemmatimonadota bacterium]